METDLLQMDIDAALCPVRYALDIIGGKWKLHILCVLAGQSPARYNEIKRKVYGITNMMLSQSLKDLEAHGIISRKQFEEIPPRVEYAITEDGRSLLPALIQLAQWGSAQMETNGEISACGQCRTQPH